MLHENGSQISWVRCSILCIIFLYTVKTDIEKLSRSRALCICIVISLQFGRFGWRSNRQRTTVLIGLLSCMTKSFSFIVFFNFRILICQHTLALRICNVSSVWLDMVNDKKRLHSSQPLILNRHRRNVSKVNLLVPKLINWTVLGRLNFH